MRELTVKYNGECKKCGALLEVGTPAMYEKSMGIFCVGCEPKDIEEVRKYRTMKAETKAEKYNTWAAKREHDATAKLNSYPEIRHDWAFITQPGHIPFRAKMIKADEKAFESLEIAKGMREKAASIMNVRVAGDAERKRQAKREALDSVIKKGSRVHDFAFGDGEVIGVYSKSYRIKFDRGYTYARDKSYVQPLGI